MNLRNLFTELKRRNVYRAAVAYGVVAWFLTQLTTQVFPFFEIPNSAVRFVVIALAVGFPIAMLLSWLYEFTPEGIVRTEDVDPVQARSVQRTTGRILDFIIIGVLLLVIAMLIVGRRPFYRQTGESISQKSIAVLPFENRSEDKANAYFADGIQDEILTRLAKIGALKVISRTSTQQYGTRPGNLSEIARQLNVANILEGSVQKAGDQVHINAQLIRAATGEHLWAESYDRKLENIFSVEAEVATAVAEALKAKLSGAEQQALAQKPTNNPEAYDAYLRGLAYSLRPGAYESDTLNAIKYFGQAVKLDPKFALAWAWLARENAQGYLFEIGDDVPALRESAKNAVRMVIELQPNLGEAYLAEGYFHYYCEDNYDSAIAAFEKGRQLSPGNSQILEALALVWRRKGQWQRSLDYFQQAKQLDPRDIQLLSLQGEIYYDLRQYPAALKLYDQVLEISPGNAAALANKATIYHAEGNLPAAATLLSQMRLQPDSPDFSLQIDQWIFERHYTEGIAVLKNAIERRDRPLRDSQKTDYASALALLQQFSGDTAAAHVTWQQVQAKVEQLRRSKGANFGFEALASAYVGLGDKAKAFAILKEYQAEVLASKDERPPAWFAAMMARIATQAGEKELALDQLAISAQGPGGVTYGDLKLNPLWDPLRGDPRFEKIVASLAPAQ
jgi:TolB-like protein/lipoprotein NlpI